MRVQVEQKRGHRRTSEGGTARDAVPARSRERTDDLKAEMDALLDEIDELLEKNAEEFVENYVQKGGE